MNNNQDYGTETHIAIFASGTGSNACRIMEHFKDHPAIHVSLIVCNKPKAGVLDYAQMFNVPQLIIEKTRFLEDDAYVSVLLDAGINFIVLAGFLWKVPDVLISNYNRRIINIHPALLPAYGGKGMYGARVHEAVIAAGEQYSGITIHYIDGHYDNGDIIFQATCAIEQGDDAISLAEKVHALEHLHFARVIEECIIGSSFGDEDLGLVQS